jgi:hypothetical protein
MATDLLCHGPRWRRFEEKRSYKVAKELDSLSLPLLGRTDDVIEYSRV